MVTQADIFAFFLYHVVDDGQDLIPFFRPLFLQLEKEKNIGNNLGF